jgi:hypothetical protein
VWRASPNYSSRPAGDIGKVAMVIIHTCEGSYSGCWGWLVNPQAGVSAHYVVKEDGSEISQLVKESNKAWHIGASYKCSLNGNLDCWRNGYSANNFTVGIEHAGFASQQSWNSNLIDKSAKLSATSPRATTSPATTSTSSPTASSSPTTASTPAPTGRGRPTSARSTPTAAPSRPPTRSPAAPSSSTATTPTTTPPPPRSPCPPTGRRPASTAGYYGTGYFYANTAPVSDAAEFSFYLGADATKTVDAWWTAGTNRAAAAPFVAFNASGTKLGTVNANQQANGGKWNQLGSFKFTKGWNKVVVSRWTTEGSVVIADAVRIR